VRPIDAAAGIVNACESLPGVVTGGQPSAAQLAALRDAGVKIILDIRDPMEPRSYDEPAEAKRLGLEYVNVPVVAGATSDAVMERILVALRGRGERPVFFHCGSGNRVGGALIPHFMLDHGLEEDDAVQRAMRVGLRSAEMLKWGLDYAHRHAP
jgi:protein tyrosine phosphatase (PTP) superfamily phosphohydrolase (DUF442 family)